MKRFGWVARTVVATILTTMAMRAPAVADAEPTADRLTSPASRAQASTMVTGEIVDSYCYMKRGAGGMGAAHRDCAIKCLKEGRTPFFRDDRDGKLYVIAASEENPAALKDVLASVARRVRLTGAVVEREGLRLLEVEEIAAEHDHGQAPHGGVVGMQGEHHLEVVAAPDSRIQVYVLDAFMKPVQLVGANGTGVIRKRDGTLRDARLVVASGGEFLHLEGETRDEDDEDVSIDLKLGRESVQMTLPFAPGDSAARPATAHEGHHH